MGMCARQPSDAGQVTYGDHGADSRGIATDRVTTEGRETFATWGSYGIGNVECQRIWERRWLRLWLCLGGRGEGDVKAVQ